MKTMLLLTLALINSLLASSQNIVQIEQKLKYDELISGTPKLIPLSVTAADLAATHQRNYLYQMRLIISDVPEAVAGALQLDGVSPQRIQSMGPAFRRLTYLIDLQVDNPAKFVPDLDGMKQQIAWSDNTLSPLIMSLPNIVTGLATADQNALKVDFCPESSVPLEYPAKKTWMYVWPREPVRMVVRHINPLKYNATLESSGVILNTDPGAALSAVSGILNPGNKLFPSSSASRSVSAVDSRVEKLRQLCSIAGSIEQRLNSLKRLECLEETNISLLINDSRFYKDLLADTPDEASLKAELMSLASIVSSLTTSATSTTSSASSTTTNAVSTTSPVGSLTTTVNSLTISKVSSFSTSADKDALDANKQYLQALAEYAKDPQLAHRIFEQLDKLDEVIDGTTLRLRPVLPSNYPGADIIRLTLTTSPKNNTVTTPIKQQFDVLVVGRFKVDFSAGLVVTGLADQVYSGRDTTFRRISTTANKPDTSDITRSIPVAERRDKITLALATMAHFYWRFPFFRGGVNIGATVGGGITQKGRPIGLAGFSVLIGRAQRWVISSGWVVGTQKELAVRYDKTASYLNSQSSTDFTYIDRTIVDGFVSLTFNWGKNERIVGSDGVTK